MKRFKVGDRVKVVGLYGSAVDGLEGIIIGGGGEPGTAYAVDFGKAISPSPSRAFTGADGDVVAEPHHWRRVLSAYLELVEEPRRFKTKDRVRVIADAPWGSPGTIRDIKEPAVKYLVEFDHAYPNHRCQYEGDWILEDRKSLWLNFDQLERVEGDDLAQELRTMVELTKGLAGLLDNKHTSISDPSFRPSPPPPVSKFDARVALGLDSAEPVWKEEPEDEEVVVHWADSATELEEKGWHIARFEPPEIVEVTALIPGGRIFFYVHEDGVNAVSVLLVDRTDRVSVDYPEDSLPTPDEAFDFFEPKP